MATNYVLSFRVPSDYEPGAETPAEWQAWFGGLGSALGPVSSFTVGEGAAFGACDQRAGRMP